VEPGNQAAPALLLSATAKALQAHVERLAGTSVSGTSSAPLLWPTPGTTLLASWVGRATRLPATGMMRGAFAAPIWRLLDSAGDVRSRSSSLARITTR